MTKQSVLGFTVALLSIIFTGCDSGTQTTQVQDIVELRWQSDESAIFGYMQSYTETATSAIPGVGYSIAKFGADGSLNQTYTLDQLAISDYSNSIFLSSDGSSLVTQLGIDLYRFGIKTGVQEKLDSSFHLIVASPDLHYVVGSHSRSLYPIKTIIVYDITHTPIREVTHFDISGVYESSGIWLNNGTFGFTCTDSIGNHVSIFDTTGTLLHVISGAEALFHNVVFNSQTNDLFVRDRASAFTDQSIDKINLSTMARTTILKDSVENFDVTRDENVIVYSIYDPAQSVTHLKSHNLQTGNEQLIANDIRLIVALSPNEDKLAYIRQRDANFTEIRVLPFTRP